jgi:hypothetical protein
MRTLTLVSTITAVTLAAACGFFARQARLESDRADAELAQRLELQQRMERLEHERRSFADELAEAETSRIDPTHAVGAARTAQPADAAKSRSDSGTPTQGVTTRPNRRFRMLQHPAGRELLRAQDRSLIEDEHQHLARDLGWTKEDQNSLIDLLVEQGMERSDLLASTPGMVDGAQLEQLSARHERQVAALLGDDKARQYRDYEDDGPLRALVAQLRGQLPQSAALSDEQAARLRTALRDVRAGFRKEMEQRYAGQQITATMGTWYGGEFISSDSLGTPRQRQFLEQIEAYHQQMGQAAARVLTTAQMNLFSQIQERRLAEQRARMWLEMNDPEGR